MRGSSVLALLLTVAVAGCLGRPNRSGRCDSDRERHCGDEDGDGIPDDEDTDFVEGDGNTSPGDPPVDEGACAGYEPLPETIVVGVRGTYYDEMDSGDVTGTVTLMLTLGTYEYDVAASASVRGINGVSLFSCEDGNGTAACYGGVSLLMCAGDGSFSFDAATGTGTWSYYDPDTGMSGSGDLLALE